MAKPIISGLGQYNPPAGSEVWPRRKGSAEGNIAGRVAQRQMTKGLGQCQGFGLYPMGREQPLRILSH